MRQRPVLDLTTWCDNFNVQNILIKQCPFVCLHINNSTNAYVSNITMTNPIDSPNTACVYADGLTNSRITKSSFSCGDDHITVLAMTTKTVNMLIDESVFYHGQGLTLVSNIFYSTKPEKKKTPSLTPITHPFIYAIYAPQHRDHKYFMVWKMLHGEILK